MWTPAAMARAKATHGAQGWSWGDMHALVCCIHFSPAGCWAARLTEHTPARAGGCDCGRARMLAVLTCVAEWEARWVADVLPCYSLRRPAAQTGQAA
jgi:hypothetical protein